MPAGPLEPTVVWESPANAMRARGPARLWDVWPQLAIALLLLAAVGLYWQWRQAASPAGVVDRCGAALKQKDWHAVYGLIAWPRYRTHMDEPTFTALAGLYGKLYALEDYSVGAPRVDGDTAIVPVTVTARFNSLVATSKHTDNADVRCRLVDGEWKIAPDLRNGFLGATIAGRGRLH